MTLKCLPRRNHSRIYSEKTNTIGQPFHLTAIVLCGIIQIIRIEMQAIQSTPRCVHNSDSIAQLCLSTKCSLPFICTTTECQHPHDLHSSESKLLLFDQFLDKWLIARQVHTVTPFIELLDEIQKQFVRFISEQKAKLLMWASLLKLNNMTELSKATGKDINESWQLIQDYNQETQAKINEEMSAKRYQFNELLRELVVKLPTT